MSRQRKHRGVYWMVAVSCLMAAACGNYVARGQQLYREGRYIESAELLALHEHELVEQTPAKLAEYATYRGLSNLILGNYPEARRWMIYAHDIERRFAGALRVDQRLELDRGWMELSTREKPKPADSSAAHAVSP